MKLLLICTHNACRSIIAEAIFCMIASDRITAKSAGSSPRGQIHPLTIKHLNRREYDTTHLKSQSWDDFDDYQPDVVITLCDQAAGETCPVFFSNSLKIHWGIADPSKSIENETKNFDEAINILEKRTRRLLNETFETMTPAELKILFEKVI